MRLACRSRRRRKRRSGLGREIECGGGLDDPRCPLLDALRMIGKAGAKWSGLAAQVGRTEN
jgi:hypothetical protein